MSTIRGLFLFLLGWLTCTGIFEKLTTWVYQQEVSAQLVEATKDARGTAAALCALVTATLIAVACGGERKC